MIKRYEMKHLSSKKFLTKYYLKSGFSVDAYQYICRIYLDEYPEQKELRQEYFEKNYNLFKHIYARFLKRN